jgi:phage terminase small subunit
MNAKHQKFCDEILGGENQTDAYLKAGFKPKTREAARKNAARLMTNADIQTYLDAAREQATARAVLTKSQVLRELSILAFSDLTEFAQWDADGIMLTPSNELDLEKRRAVKSVKVKRTTRTNKDGTVEVTVETEFKLWSKETALKMLGDHLGLFDADDKGKDGDFTEYLNELEQAVQA